MTSYSTIIIASDMCYAYKCRKIATRESFTVSVYDSMIVATCNYYFP